MGIARHQMKKIIFLVSLLLHQMWSQKCDNKFPSHRKAPAINHSNPDNKPTITTCRKDRNDKYNFCQCYDKAGSCDNLLPVVQRSTSSSIFVNFHTDGTD